MVGGGTVGGHMFAKLNLIRTDAWLQKLKLAFRLKAQAWHLQTELKL